MKAETLDSGNVPLDTICLFQRLSPSPQPQSRLVLGYKYPLHPSQLRFDLHPQASSDLTGPSSPTAPLYLGPTLHLLDFHLPSLIQISPA